MEIYNNKEFKLLKLMGGWCYQIELGRLSYISSLFDTEQEARFAAIGHITLLENGEG